MEVLANIFRISDLTNEILRKGNTKGHFTLSHFQSQLLLKLEEFTYANDNSFQAKQCQTNNWIQKNGSCESTLRHMESL